MTHTDSRDPTRPQSRLGPWQRPWGSGCLIYLPSETRTSLNSKGDQHPNFTKEEFGLEGPCHLPKGISPCDLPPIFTTLRPLQVFCGRCCPHERPLRKKRFWGLPLVGRREKASHSLWFWMTRAFSSIPAWLMQPPFLLPRPYVPVKLSDSVFIIMISFGS